MHWNANYTTRDLCYHVKCTLRQQSHWFHVSFWAPAEAAVWVQPHGLHHRAGRRYGNNRSHEYSRHQTWHNPPEGSCSAGLPWWCAGVYLHLQETRQMRCHQMSIFCTLLQPSSSHWTSKTNSETIRTKHKASVICIYIYCKEQELSILSFSVHFFYSYGP